MAEFLLALAFIMTLLIGFWMALRLDRFLDKRKDGGKDENDSQTRRNP